MPLTGDDVLEIWYTNDNAVRELWVDAVMVGGPAPLPYHASLPAVRHAEGTPQPPPAADEGVTIQAEGGAMLYGKGGFQAPNVLPGQQQLDEAGALRFAVGEGAYAAEYDQNGNMTSRVVAGQAQVLEWDAENRLVGITQGTSVSTFLYDGDGNRVKATVDGVSTVYIGGYYEETAGTVRTYYYHAGQRVAMREAGVTTWLLSDHLGSTSVAYRASDGQATSQRYYAWGTIRPGPENELPTDYTFTGQKLDERSGLLYYVARWYDRFVGRFLSPDSIVPEPGDPQSLNRFAYAGNNPLRYSDPTGHYTFEESPDDRWHLSNPRVRSAYWYTQPEWDPEPQSDAGIIVAATSPVWVPVATVVGVGLVADVAVPAAQAAVSEGVKWLLPLGKQVYDAASDRALYQFSQAWKYGIDAYTRLSREVAGKGLEVHHIIEARFAEALDLDARWILSVALTPEEHQVFTNLWRAAIPYGTSAGATVERVWEAAQLVYARHPAFLEAARQTLLRVP